LRKLVAGLLGLLCTVSVADAQDGGVFKILKLEGHQVRWQVPRNGEPRVLTYQLATDAVEIPGARNCRKITKLDDLVTTSQIDPTGLRAELAAAFSMWEQVANITFQEAPAGTRADILIGAQVEPEGWAFADVFYDTASVEPVKPISRALVCLNPLRAWKIGFDGDLKRYDLRYTFAHEIGHAIGLDHPHGGEQVMGYRYEERFRTLQEGDIRGAVALYGGTRDTTIDQAQFDPGQAVNSAPERRLAKRSGTRSLAPRAP
jgi:hypothetical protein